MINPKVLTPNGQILEAISTWAKIEMVEGSQEEYCRGCILVPGCNVILKDGESCGDKYDGAVQPIDYRMNEMEYDEWEALGDNVPGNNLV